MNTVLIKLNDDYFVCQMEEIKMRRIWRALIFTAESMHAQENADETITVEKSLGAKQ